MNDRSGAPGLRYLPGLGAHHEWEAMEGALPVGQNSPQKVPFGLYAEQLSASSSTAPRSHTLRSWLYRLRPSAMHKPYRRVGEGQIRTAPCREAECSPNRLRWGAFEPPTQATDFIAGLATVATCGDAAAQRGVGVHVYAANRSMEERRFCYDADGELLIVAQHGALRLVTEFGTLVASPGEIAVVPRGVRFRAEIEGDWVRGYVCENYGAPLRLPELGLIGSNGLASPRDFLAPVAAYEDRDAPTEVIAKFAGHLWKAQYDHSPLDVVAWRGNYYPYKYDLARFNAMNTVTFDHPDPSIFTVLTSPSETPGLANVDFVIFPPRWMVSEHTFRPPWFHRNFMNEFMGLIHGEYDAKAEGFVPGGSSLHNCMAGHGPDTETFEKASKAELKPVYVKDTMAFMFETRFVCQPTKFALETSQLDHQYFEVWQGLKKKFKT